MSPHSIWARRLRLSNRALFAQWEKASRRRWWRSLQHRSARIRQPILVAAVVKIVDPGAYPFYGRLGLTSGADARAILGAGELIASPDLLESLGVKVGGRIRIAETDFRIGGVIAAEPDRFCDPERSRGPRDRVDDGRETRRIDRFWHAGLFPRAAAYPARSGSPRTVHASRGHFPRRARDRLHEPHTGSAVSVWIVPVLNVIGFLALALGAVAIGATVYFHLLRNLDTVAILKCLGATTQRIVSVYLTQVLALTSAAVLCGIAGRHWAESLLAWTCVRFFGIELSTAGASPPISGIIVLSLASAILAALVPLSRIGRTSSAVLLRRNAGEPPQRQSSGSNPALVITAVAFVALLSCQAAGPWSIRFYVALALVAMLLVADRVIRIFITIASRTVLIPALPWFLRQGIANIHRYHAQVPRHDDGPGKRGRVCGLCIDADRAFESLHRELDPVPFSEPSGASSRRNQEGSVGGRACNTRRPSRYARVRADSMARPRSRRRRQARPAPRPQSADLHPKGLACHLFERCSASCRGGCRPMVDGFRTRARGRYQPRSGTVVRCRAGKRDGVFRRKSTRHSE